MRFSPGQKLTAADIVNTYPEAELAEVLFKYGEEVRSRRIARLIVERRPIRTTSELARVVEQATGGRQGRIHPATRTFMALRVAVNCEFDNLMRGLEKASTLIAKSGRMAIISFHSLEDRLVKETFRSMVSVGGWKNVTTKAVKPSQAEVNENGRARSARLRVIEKI